ncbi:MAG: hypothetical protein J6A59_13590 [Lachnospiraceae bacterium]|nr:hypothetical protein [Lachnospiraceae bacterium]
MLGDISFRITEITLCTKDERIYKELLNRYQDMLFCSGWPSGFLYKYDGQPEGYSIFMSGICGEINIWIVCDKNGIELSKVKEILNSIEFDTVEKDETYFQSWKQYFIRYTLTIEWNDSMRFDRNLITDYYYAHYSPKMENYLNIYACENSYRNQSPFEPAYSLSDNVYETFYEAIRKSNNEEVMKAYKRAFLVRKIQ